MYVFLGNSSLSTSAVNSVNPFREHLTITDAYSILMSRLNSILKYCDLSTLKAALIYQTDTPDGVTLRKALRKKIKSAKSSFDLLCTIKKVRSCSWLDIRLIRVLAHGSGYKSAVDLVDAYKACVFSKKLTDALPSFSKLSYKKAFIAAVSTKVKVDADKITVGDVVQHQWSMEKVILDLGKKILNIRHVKRGCLEICYHVPIHYSFNVYKMALHNCHSFYKIDLMHVEIGDHPLIYDPWLWDIDEQPVKQILHIQNEGT